MIYWDWTKPSLLTPYKEVKFELTTGTKWCKLNGHLTSKIQSVAMAT